MFTVIEIKSDCWPGTVVFTGDAESAAGFFLERLGKPDIQVSMFDGSLVPLGAYVEAKKKCVGENNS